MYDLGYTPSDINVAEENEFSASKFAKVLIDYDFYKRMRCSDELKCNDMLPNFWETFGATKGLGTPNDILWTTPYLAYAVSCYGPNIIVIDPEANIRSLSLGDWKKFNHQWTSGRDIMGGEIVHPGYIYGSSIRGFELRSQTQHIRLAFYERKSIIDQAKSYVIVVAPTDVSTYCIVNNENLAPASNMKSPPLIPCDFYSTKGLNQKMSTYTVTNFHNFLGPCNSMCDSTFTKKPLMDGVHTSLPVTGRD